MKTITNLLTIQVLSVLAVNFSCSRTDLLYYIRQPIYSSLQCQGRHGKFEPSKVQYSTHIFLMVVSYKPCLHSLLWGALSAYLLLNLVNVYMMRWDVSNIQILCNGFHETLCLSLSRKKKFWHIYCCFVIMLKLWSLKMCYAVWSFMIYVQLPFIQFLHFHDLFKREEFIINWRKAIKKTSLKWNATFFRRR